MDGCVWDPEANRRKRKEKQPVLLLIVGSYFGLIFSLTGIKRIQDGGAN